MSTIILVDNSELSESLSQKGVQYYDIMNSNSDCVDYCYFVCNETLLEEAGSIGYHILPEHREKGYTTSAVVELINRTHQNDVLVIKIEESNQVSKRVIRKAAAHIGAIVDETLTGIRLRKAK